MEVLSVFTTLFLMASMVVYLLSFIKRPYAALSVVIFTILVFVIGVTFQDRLFGDQLLLDFDERFVLISGGQGESDVLSSDDSYRSRYVTNMTPLETVEYVRKFSDLSPLERVISHFPGGEIIAYRSIEEYGMDSAESTYMIITIQYPIMKSVSVSIIPNHDFARGHKYPTEVLVVYALQGKNK